MDTVTQVRPLATSYPLLPLLRVVGDLLSSDIELLAAMQRLAFRVLNQEGDPCQK